MMTMDRNLSFTLAKFAFAYTSHSAGRLTNEKLFEVCGELVGAIRQNESLKTIIRGERERRYGWHPRDQ